MSFCVLIIEVANADCADNNHTVPRTSTYSAFYCSWRELLGLQCATVEGEDATECVGLGLWCELVDLNVLQRDDLESGFLAWIGTEDKRQWLEKRFLRSDFLAGNGGHEAIFKGLERNTDFTQNWGNGMTQEAIFWLGNGEHKAIFKGLEWSTRTSSKTDTMGWLEKQFFGLEMENIRQFLRAWNGEHGLHTKLMQCDGPSGLLLVGEFECNWLMLE